MLPVEICTCVQTNSCMCVIFYSLQNAGVLHLSKTKSLVAQMVKRLPTMWETWVRFLGWEELLEKEMATHSNTLAWKILWKEEPGRLVHGVTKSRTRLSDFTHSLNVLKLLKI